VDAVRPRGDHGTGGRIPSLGNLRRLTGAADPAGAIVPVAATVPGLARVAGAAAANTALWASKTYVKTSWRLAKATVDRGELTALTRDAIGVLDNVVVFANAVLGTPVQALSRMPGAAAVQEHLMLADEPIDDTPEGLRRRGAALLDRSADVTTEDDGHPAYSRILTEIAPDEARILRLLIEGGPQPSVDVRTGGFGNSELVAPGLQMIGPRAGTRKVENTPAYLNNLFRLGLIWFSKEPVEDHEAYQVLEAQPDVLSAFHSVRFAKIVRRSIHLTPFGEGFARMVLIQNADRELPEHAAPMASEESAPPKG
jgi:hypothetical protein